MDGGLRDRSGVGGKREFKDLTEIKEAKLVGLDWLKKLDGERCQPQRWRIPGAVGVKFGRKRIGLIL